MSLLRRAALLAIASVALIACDNRSGGLDSVVRPATLSFYSNQDSVALPDTAVAGVPFTASVRSYGGGCVSKDQTLSGVSGQSAFIRPFVREPAPDSNIGCADVLYFFSHDVELVFDQPGTATVRVYGLREPDRTSHTVTRTVQIVPPRPTPF